MNKVKIWYDPDQRFFKAFMPDGNPIPFLGKIVIDDGFENGHQTEYATATITIKMVDIVTECPKLL